MAVVIHDPSDKIKSKVNDQASETLEDNVPRVEEAAHYSRALVYIIDILRNNGLMTQQQYQEIEEDYIFFVKAMGFGNIVQSYDPKAQGEINISDEWPT